MMQAAHTQDFILLPVVIRDEQRRREDTLQVMAKPGPADVRQRPGEHELGGRVTLPSVSGNTNMSSVNDGTNKCSFPTHLGLSADSKPDQFPRLPLLGYL